MTTTHTPPNGLALADPLGTLDLASRDRVAQVIAAGKTTNTLRAYASDLRQIVAYLRQIGAHHLLAGDTLAAPVPAALVCGYLVERAETGTATSTLRRHLATLAKWHQVRETATGLPHPNPCASQLVADTVQGLRKTETRRPRKAAPLRADSVRQIVAAAPDGPAGVRDTALVLVGWCAALRRSELAALTWGDIDRQAGGLVVTVRAAKTGTGQQVGVPSQANPAWCPVAALDRWQQIAPDTGPDAPVFTQVTQAGQATGQALSGQAVGAIVARAARRAGAGQATGHSLRSGLATEAVLAGRPEAEVMTTTRHRSQQVFRGYVRDAELLPRAASRGLLA